MISLRALGEDSPTLCFLMRTLIFRAPIELRSDQESTVKYLTIQSGSRHLMIRWAKLRGSAAIILFLAVAVFIQVIVVSYAVNLGIKDTGVLTVNWPVTFTLSPLFHLVPIAVIVSNLFTWIYLTKKLSVRPTLSIGKTEASTGKRAELRQPVSKKGQLPFSEKPKPSVLGVRGIWQRLYFARATIKSALTVFLAFLGVVFIVSMLTYPASIYQTLTESYQNHSSLYDFVVSVANSLKGFAQAAAPIGWIATAINNGLAVISPGIRSVGLALGGLTAPLANLDAAGKYLAFQNAATWISVLLILFCGQFSRKSYRYKKK